MGESHKNKTGNKRIGRPAIAPPIEGDRLQLSTRITAEMKRRLLGRKDNASG